MRDLQAEIAARLARYDSDIGGSDHAAIAIQFVGDLRAILAEFAEGDIEDATLPLMPTSKRTVTLYEKPAPKSYRCTECGESVADVVVMPDGTRHKGHDGFWCGPVEETP